MAIAASLVVALGLDSARLTTGLANANRQIRRFNRDIRNSFQNLNNQFNTFAGELLVVGAATGFLIGDIIRVTSRFEDLRTALESVTGSAEAGADAFEFISDFATRTQFSVEDLTTTFIQLRAAGIQPTEDLLTLFTDTAAVTTDQLGALQSITALFARTTAGGLGLEELNRLADRGIPVFDILNETLGISRLEVSELGQSAEGARLILDALSEGLSQRFGGATAARVTNLSTTVSNLGIAFRQLQDDIGQRITPAFRELLAAMNIVTGEGTRLSAQFGDFLSAVIRRTAGLILALAGNFDRLARLTRLFLTAWLAVRAAAFTSAIVGVIGQVVIGIGSLATVLRTAGLAAIAFQASTGVGLITALASLAGATAAVAAFNNLFAENSEDVATVLTDFTTPAIEETTDAIDGAITSTETWMQRLAELTMGSGPGTLTSFERTLENAADTTSRLSELGSRAFDGLADSLTDFTFNGMNNFRDFARSIIQDLIRIQIRAQLVQLFQAASGGGLFAGFFQNGGFIPRGQYGIVGEAGPEIVRGPANVTSARGTEEILSGGSGTNITFNVQAIDVQSFTETVTQPQYYEAIAAAMDLSNRDRGLA